MKTNGNRCFFLTPCSLSDTNTCTIPYAYTIIGNPEYLCLYLCICSCSLADEEKHFPGLEQKYLFNYGDNSDSETDEVVIDINNWQQLFFINTSNCRRPEKCENVFAEIWLSCAEYVTCIKVSQYQSRVGCGKLWKQEEWPIQEFVKEVVGDNVTTSVTNNIK